MAIVQLEDVRISYPNLFEPKAALGSDIRKYSVCVLIPKSDTAQVEKIKAAIDQAIEEGKKKFGEANFKNIPASKLPLHDGDIDKPDSAEYQGMYYLNCSSREDQPPIVVNRQVEQIMDPSEIYAGCYCNVNISIYPYNNAAKGVSAGLNGVQKLKDGERLDGRPTLAQMFKAIPDNDFETDF